MNVNAPDVKDCFRGVEILILDLAFRISSRV